MNISSFLVSWCNFPVVYNSACVSKLCPPLLEGVRGKMREKQLNPTLQLWQEREATCFAPAMLSFPESGKRGKSTL